ncbi:ATP-binding protein [Mesorhizobium sp. L-8-3]|uniref:ATP-binding protein n=1 Tax=Mesorhizobium sp. L-8-3 TaxID=2744522 RepID=UPI0019258737|nr:ATP-binding protein [Mesorhizobium sp. L-8-3]BCH27601.1 hypothetical protein MesoLjLb_73860 [Mesorhizobium sp. L-8-3]
MNVPAPHDDIAKAIRDALLPQRFPVRRDVELGAGTAQEKEAVSFHDTVWLGHHFLAVAAVRVKRGGIGGALAAAALRQLLRAALSVTPTPEAALAACEEICATPGFDAAVLRLDLVTGAVESATRGQARIETTRHGEGGRLSPGEIVWLGAGDVPLPAELTPPVEGPEGLVQPAIARAGGGSAAALLYKAHGRAAGSSTFAVPNDAGAIPGVLAQIDAFCARHAIAREDVEGIDVAVDEVLSNAIAYAFRDGHAHEIFVTSTAEPGRLVIEISDDGVPFDPLAVPPPDLSADLEARQVGGLGMHFVRNLLDDVAYKRVNGWNVLTLRKRVGEARKGESSS